MPLFDSLIIPILVNIYAITIFKQASKQARIIYSLKYP